ncbi:MAG: hypothetical protein GTO24_14610 [candidate division Zixibacteria bacterium]|nr:hypothetical protein [candidate division Zixibacteria bacterium]
MKCIVLRFACACILASPAFLVSGCFSTLQTAKVEGGFSFTSGVYTYAVEKYGYPKSHYEDHFLFILMPRYGRAATERRMGTEIGLRLLTDMVDEGKVGEPFAILLGEFKLQIPKNRYLELALGLDFYFFYPGSIYLLASKDLSKTFTLYGSGELFGGLYSFAMEENEIGLYPKMALGTQMSISKNVSVLAEMEKWFYSEWDWRENLRFAAGVKVVSPR